MKKNLISTGKIFDQYGADVKITLSKTAAIVQTGSGHIIASGTRKTGRGKDAGLWICKVGKRPPKHVNQWDVERMKEDELGVYMNSVNEGKNAAVMWHRRLGHIGHEKLKLIRDNNKLATGVQFTDEEFEELKRRTCSGCAQGKMKRNSHGVGYHKASRIGGRVVSDVQGPFKISAAGRNHRYFVTFIDEVSSWTMTYGMARKSEVLSKFKRFIGDMQTILPDFKIDIFRSDGGGEYSSK